MKTAWGVFRGDPICHFEIIAILILRRFALKMPIHDPKMRVFRGVGPLNRDQY